MTLVPRFTPWRLVRPSSTSLPLAQHGLEWVHGEAPVAHPLDDGTAVVLERDLSRWEANSAQMPDHGGGSLNQFVDHWDQLPKTHSDRSCRFPHHPLLMARFGLAAMQPAHASPLAFQRHRARALFAGLAAHSLLTFDRLSVRRCLGAGRCRSRGWLANSTRRSAIHHARTYWPSPVPRRKIAHFPPHRCASFPRLGPAILSRSSTRRPRHYSRWPATPSQATDTIQLFQHGPGAFKVDYAFSPPVPWAAPECRRAITVHLGGTFEEIAAG